MAGNVRDRMIEGAMALLARRGLEATSFSEVLAATGAPRGSLYHHFPGGKDELVAAALDRAGAILLEAMEPAAGGSAEAVALRFLAIWRAVLTRSDCEAGCAVLAVTAATGSTELRARAAGVFRAWRTRLGDLFTQGGMTASDAPRLAVAMIASVEGAVVLSRAERSVEPFEAVASQLIDQVRASVAAQSRPV